MALKRFELELVSSRLGGRKPSVFSWGINKKYKMGGFKMLDASRNGNIETMQYESI